ncbi:MAG: MarR family transcriptional regulator [Candidimonas sp.]|nr:MAG: MarR family transcriptional regulator [Candidimonas sp.]TAM26807.1 MAG: MarR family transcriptional regulator [Candidimonas sp.]TAM79278.1 MAG: MarR family transcriptional regulator [Candidimonas sp.]
MNNAPRPLSSQATPSPSNEAASACDPFTAGHKAGAKSTFYRPDEQSLKQDSNVGHLIKNVYASINRMIDQGVAPIGLTSKQWKPLIMICHHDINTPAELSRVTNVDTGAMTRVLDRLEAKGFISRHRCLEDRRVVKLELTDSGQQVIGGILGPVADTLNTHLAGFSKQETELLLKFLQRMIANGANPAAHTASPPTENGSQGEAVHKPG